MPGEVVTGPGAAAASVSSYGSSGRGLLGRFGPNTVTTVPMSKNTDPSRSSRVTRIGRFDTMWQESSEH
jgi:hypothetical protein